MKKGGGRRNRESWLMTFLARWKKKEEGVSLPGGAHSWWRYTEGRTEEALPLPVAASGVFPTFAPLSLPGVAVSSPSLLSPTTASTQPTQPTKQENDQPARKKPPTLTCGLIIPSSTTVERKSKRETTLLPTKEGRKKGTCLLLSFTLSIGMYSYMRVRDDEL